MSRSLEDEKQTVKRSLGATMHEGAIWQPISTGWMDRWKMYVNYDQDGPDQRDREVKVYYRASNRLALIFLSHSWWKACIQARLTIRPCKESLEMR